MSKYRIDQDFFEHINTEQKAYIVGFIIGDGNIMYHPGRKSFEGVKINLKSTDIHILDRIRKEMGSNHKIVTKTYETTFGPSTQSFLMMYSAKIAHDLANIGVAPKKQMREVLPDVGYNLERHLIRGIFDADGGFHKSSSDGSWDLYIEGSEELLNKCKEIFIKNISIWLPSKCVRWGHGCYEFRVSGHRARVIAEWLYNKAEIYLDRKYHLFNEISQEIPLSESMNLAKLDEKSLASAITKNHWLRLSPEEKRANMEHFDKFNKGFAQTLRRMKNDDFNFAIHIGLGNDYYYSPWLNRWVTKDMMDKRHNESVKSRTGIRHVDDFNKALVGILNAELSYAKSLGLEKCRYSNCKDMGRVRTYCKSHYKKLLREGSIKRIADTQ